MASVTLTKPAKWSWASGSIETPSDADNLLLCEPFWTEDDWSIANGATHTDLTGKTFTFADDSTPTFDWVSGDDANVGGAVIRNSNVQNNHGLSATDASFAITDYTLLFVVKRIGTGTGFWWFGNTNSANGRAIRFSSSGQIQWYSFFSGSVVFSSTGTVADGEWHVVGLVINPTANAYKVFIDGVAAGNGTISSTTLTNRRGLFGSIADVAAQGTIAFGLWAEWSAAKGDSFMTAITADPYRLLRESSGTPTGSPVYAYSQM
jgi:hypothetical protein